MHRSYFQYGLAQELFLRMNDDIKEEHQLEI